MRITLKNAAKLQHFFHTHNNCQHFLLNLCHFVSQTLHSHDNRNLTKWHKLRFFHNKQHLKTKINKHYR